MRLKTLRRYLSKISENPLSPAADTLKNRSCYASNVQTITPLNLTREMPTMNLLADKMRQRPYNSGAFIISNGVHTFRWIIPFRSF